MVILDPVLSWLYFVALCIISCISLVANSIVLTWKPPNPNDRLHFTGLGHILRSHDLSNLTTAIVTIPLWLFILIMGQTNCLGRSRWLFFQQLWCRPSTSGRSPCGCYGNRKILRYLPASYAPKSTWSPRLHDKRFMLADCVIILWYIIGLKQLLLPQLFPFAALGFPVSLSW